MESEGKNLSKRMFDNPPPKPGFPDESKFPRIVSARIPCSQEELEEHLNKYVQKLLDEGASEAKIVPVKDIPQDPRVLLKCYFPKCPAYGRSGSCPPHVIGDFQKAREFLGAYEWAIVYRVNLSKERIGIFTGPSQITALKNKEYYHASGSVLRYVYGMGDLVERDAFYDGHYFVINCHFGPCLYEHCEEFRDCQEMKVGICRFPFKAKPSVEQFFCIDFLKLAARLGWEYYMLGPCALIQDFPEEYEPYLIGVILIT